MSHTLRLLAGVILLGSLLLGQAQTTRNEVLGLTWSSGQTDPSLLWQKMDHAGCAQRSCTVVGFERGSGSLSFAGGTAHNGDVPPNLSKSLGGVWVSNGSKIALVDPDTCGYRCQPQPAPLRGSQSKVTGLAYVEETATLFMSDSENLLYWVETGGCVLSPVVCDQFQKTVLKSPYVIGGLAADDLRRRLFVSASVLGSPGGPNKIFVFSFGSPGKPVPASWCASSGICEMVVPACGTLQLGPLTGLGFDATTDTLYYTDGRNTVASRVAYDPGSGSCGLTVLGCCGRSSGDPFSGLCVMQKRAISSGKACVMAPCIDCPSMRAGTYGDAFLGNKNFAPDPQRGADGGLASLHRLWGGALRGARIADWFL